MVKRRPPKSPVRRFVTPEGVDLRLELGSAGARAGAFAIDGIVIVVLLVLMTIGATKMFGTRDSGAQAAVIIWLIAFFVLRNGWFVLFEMGGRGATPGKRVLKLRVVARDGARLTGGAVIARNAMREIEIFLPLSFLGARVADGTGGTTLTIASLLWSGTFLFFPLFNRDRLRVGDLLAGTWVVRVTKRALGTDITASDQRERPRRQFTAAALDLYGIYELQTLERVLREDSDDALTTVAAAIRRKAGLPDDRDDRAFLADYYAALCIHLERGLSVGQRRENKFDPRSVRMR